MNTQFSMGTPKADDPREPIGQSRSLFSVTLCERMNTPMRRVDQFELNQGNSPSVYAPRTTFKMTESRRDLLAWQIREPGRE